MDRGWMPSAAPAFKPGFDPFIFFIRNHVFLSQILPAFLQTIQIPPEFRQANMPNTASIIHEFVQNLV